MKNYIKVNIEDEEYPKQLKGIKNAPKTLYMQGNYSLLNNDILAIVGSRECSDYGFRQSYQFAKELSKKGICIVSGLAEGIDTSAHLGAMHQKGKTIAVLGSGLKEIFPKENEVLANSIIKNDGLIISEYDAYVKAKSQYFPKRNRIMSGLATAVLIIEAKQKSGSLITGRYAKEQGKKLYCLPSNINNITSKGTNTLIKTGAKVITEFNELVKELIKQEDIIKYPEINEEYKKVYNILTITPIHISEICRKVNMQISEINMILTMLEIEGLIKALPNNEFIKKY